PPSMLDSCLEREAQLKIQKDEKPIEALMKLACHGISNSSEVVKLANVCSTKNCKEISAQKDFLVLLPNGLSQARKSFSLSDLTIHLSRQFRLVFFANFRQLVTKNIFCWLLLIFL